MAMVYLVVDYTEPSSAADAVGPHPRPATGPNATDPQRANIHQSEGGSGVEHRTLTVVSDSGWRVVRGPTVLADIYLGATYDARLATPESCMPACNCTTSGGRAATNGHVVQQADLRGGGSAGGGVFGGVAGGAVGLTAAQCQWVAATVLPSPLLPNGKGWLRAHTMPHIRRRETLEPLKVTWFPPPVRTPLGPSPTLVLGISPASLCCYIEQCCCETERLSITIVSITVVKVKFLVGAFSVAIVTNP
jgi:hypothetical protein